MSTRALVESALRRGLSHRETRRLVGCSKSYVEKVSAMIRPVNVTAKALGGQPDDERHWRACLEAGGFVWREVIDGQVVEFRPRAA